MLAINGADPFDAVNANAQITGGSQAFGTRQNVYVLFMPLTCIILEVDIFNRGIFVISGGPFHSPGSSQVTTERQQGGTTLWATLRSKHFPLLMKLALLFNAWAATPLRRLRCVCKSTVLFASFHEIGVELI